MIGPVSSTGRSMMASLQQAIQKGMPPDQAIAYVKSMATEGVAPLTDLYTMMNQFQRLKQQQVQPPQTPPTIKDTLNQMDMQQRMQGAGNVQQMQAGAPAPQPMDRGLGAIDAGRMQYPQFAGGGIVVFDDGGFVTKPKEQDPFQPDPNVQRQIREQAGIYDPNDMSAADKFRFYGMPTEPGQRASDADAFKYALRNVANDPAAIGAGLGAIAAGPIGIPVGGYLGRVVGPLVGKAEGGVIHMAGGTPKAMTQDPWYQPVTNFFGDIARGFAPAGGAEFGMTEVEPFQSQEMYDLSKDPSVTSEQLIAAYRKAVSEKDPRAEQLGQILVNRKLGKEVERANVELAPNKPVSAAQQATALGQNLGVIPKPPAPAAPTTAATPKPTGPKAPGLGGGTYGDFSKIRSAYTDIEKQLKPAAEKTVEQNLADIEALQKKQGIGEASRKRGEYLTQREAEAAKGLDQDKRMALAQAGFAMAEAASRRGRERTGFLGAAAIGGTTGTKLYQAALKENQAIKDRIAENRFALDQADELRKSGNIKDANAMEKEAKANLRALGMARIQSEQGIAELQTRESGMDRRTLAEIASQEKRYGQGLEMQRMKLMQSVLKEAPYIIKDYNKMSKDEQAAAIHSLLSGLTGSGGLSGTIESIED